MCHFLGPPTKDGFLSVVLENPQKQTNRGVPMVVSLYCGGKSHVSNGQNVSFKEPCTIVWVCWWRAAVSPLFSRLFMAFSLSPASAAHGRLSGKQKIQPCTGSQVQVPPEDGFWGTKGSKYFRGWLLWHSTSFPRGWEAELASVLTATCLPKSRWCNHLSHNQNPVL